MSRSVRLVLALGLALASALPARAQSELEEGEVAAPEPFAGLSLLDRFGPAALARRLSADDVEVRARAIERLGAFGGSEALAQLTASALERRSRWVGREWLALARALASSAGEQGAQRVLALLVNQAPALAAGPDERALLELARGEAALALASGGGRTGLEVLGRALRAGGLPAAAAGGALLAHPPASLEPLLDPASPPSVELAQLLGELGDQRAFHALRAWARTAEDEARAAAALALTRLGHLETVPLAARWLAQAQGARREAALDIASMAGDERGAAELAVRLGRGAPDADDRARLLASPSPALAGAALARAERAGGDDFVWPLLGRIGGAEAAARLERALGEPDRAMAAAQGLSKAADPPSRSALARALAAGVALPLVLRAAAARGRFSGEPIDGFDARVREALGSGDPAARAAGAWARSLQGGQAAVSELRSGDEVRVLAAASAALVFDAAAAEGAAALLESAPPGRVRTALGACLASPAARRRVSSGRLWALVAEAGPARPLALRELASRDDPGLRSALPSYLAHPDPLLREHVARGLGESQVEGAVGLLRARLRLETDEGARHALVLALAAHPGRTASDELGRIARLDPSPRVRAAARLAVAGVALSDPPPGREVAWLELRSVPAGRGNGGERAAERTGQGESDARPEAPGERAALAARSGGATAEEAAPSEAAHPLGRGAEPPAALLVRVAPGLAIPVLADPSGLVVVAGLPAAHLGIRLQ